MPQTLITAFDNSLFACEWWQHLWNLVKEVDNQAKANQHQDVNQYLFDTIFQTGTNIVRQLSLAGRYSAALHNWLKPLSLVEPVKQKATILNLIGKQYHHLGDFTQALPWLKKCLSIQQDIGDKAGEGTTLNNISAIHHANGDYNTALQFLQQSLKIQQDIGDQSGLCATLFNMGHIHAQNKEIPEAMSCWLSVYAMAKPMQLAQALDALENLAPHIGLEDGLEGWERLYQQHKQSDVTET